MKLFRIFASFSAVLSLAAVGARADAPSYHYEVKPALLNASGPEERTLAARYEVSMKSNFANDKITGYFFADSDGTVALKSAANSENITAEIGSGLWERVGGTVAPLANDKPFDPTAANTVVAPAARIHDFLLNADLKVGFESDQLFDNNQLTVGPRVGFTQTANDGFWPLVPSVSVSYQRIHVLHSNFLEQTAIPQRTFWRLEVDASWKWRPFERESDVASWLKPIGLHADVRYFQNYDVPTAETALSLDKNFYTAGTVSYETTGLGWKYVRSLYVTVAQGRLPPSTRANTTVFLGVVFSE